MKTHLNNQNPLTSLKDCGETIPLFLSISFHSYFFLKYLKSFSCKNMVKHVHLIHTNKSQCFPTNASVITQKPLAKSRMSHTIYPVRQELGYPEPNHYNHENDQLQPSFYPPPVVGVHEYTAPGQESGDPSCVVHPSVVGVPGYPTLVQGSTNTPPSVIPNAPPQDVSCPNPVQGYGYPPSIYTIPQGQLYPMNPQETVIQTQPLGNGGQAVAISMPAPPNCPPGLEYLTLLDQLLVHQKYEFLEAFTGIEMSNRYVVKNSMGQKVFFAAEISGCCSRYWCGSIRSFEMMLIDNLGHEVIHLSRPLACKACCFPCCLQTMNICSPPGTVIGSIKQDWNIFAPFFAPKFSLRNAEGETVLKIHGPFLTCSCCCNDVKFDVLGLDGTKVGKISKQWSGVFRECYTDADNFGVSFPLDMDVKMKAVLLGACFLIDYMFFEGNQNRRR